MTEGIYRKEFGGLRPDSDDAYRMFGKIKNGVLVVADVRDPGRRSGQQHAFWFVLATIIYESQSLYQNFEDFRACLLIKLGYCNRYPQKDGSTTAVAKSLAFGKMSQDEFGKLVDDTLDFAEAMGFNRDALLAMTRERAA